MVHDVQYGFLSVHYGQLFQHQIQFSVPLGRLNHHGNLVHNLLLHKAATSDRVQSRQRPVKNQKEQIHLEGVEKSHEKVQKEVVKNC